MTIKNIIKKIGYVISGIIIVILIIVTITGIVLGFMSFITEPPRPYYETNIHRDPKYRVLPIFAYGMVLFIIIAFVLQIVFSYLSFRKEEKEREERDKYGRKKKKKKEKYQ